MATLVCFHAHPDGETLGERRAVETRASAELGCVDLVDTPTSEGEGSSWRADPEEAATRLAAILTEEQADVVGDHLATKRASMRAHASQIAESSFFLAMPEEVFAMAFGREWFARRGAPVPVESFSPWPEGLSGEGLS